MTKRSTMLLMAMLVLFSAVAHAAPSQSEIDRSMDQAEDHLEVLARQQRELTDQIDDLDGKLTALNRELEETALALETTRGDIEIHQDRVGTLENSIAQRQALLDNRVRAIYMSGDLSILSYLLETENVSQLWDRIVYLSSMARSDRLLIDQQNRERAELETVQGQLEDALEELVRLEEKQQRDIDEAEALKAEMHEKLKHVIDEKEATERQIEELEEWSRKLEEALRKAAEPSPTKGPAASTATPNNAQNQGAATPTPSPTPPPASSSQGMVWPVPGFYRITSKFGYRNHPINGVYKMHNGIDIGSNWDSNQSIYGANFVAVKDGTVIMAAPYPSLTSGYGNCVIIDHGNGVTSLYAHGSSILVSKGDTVKQGDSVMKVGSTGASTGAHAHFEIRINGSPTDPQGYVSP